VGYKLKITKTASAPEPKKKEKKEKQRTFLQLLVGTFFITFPFICLMKWLWPSLIPFDIFQFWVWDGDTIWDGVKAGLPIFIWGFSIQFFFTCFHKFKKEEIDNAENFLVGGAIISTIAGVFEELIFRWVLLYSAFIGVQLANFLLFGFVPWMLGDWWSWLELPRLLSWYVVLPIADFMTLRYFSEFLVNQGWLLGAAVIAANAKFRDGHKYQGLLGYVNSWYLGLFLFFIMFKYGIVAAILVHFTYDMVIFWVIFLHAAFRRSIRDA